MKLLNLAASGELTFASQTVIFYTPNTPLTLPNFGTTPLNCQYSTTPHKQCVHQETDLTDHSPDCPVYTPVAVLLAIAIQCFALIACFQILTKIWRFCIIFGHLIPGKIFKFVSTRCQILRLKCIKLNFGLHWGNLQRTQTLSVDLRGLLLRKGGSLGNGG